MSEPQKVIDAIAAARRRADAHLSGNRDPALPPELDGQVERFRDLLGEMLNELNSGQVATRPVIITRIIADSWPYDSELASLMTKAEQTFLNYADGQSRRVSGS